MRWNAKLIAGILIVAAALYYWLVLQRTGSSIPILYMFTFRMFPFADVLWTIAAVTLLYRGYVEARTA